MKTLSIAVRALLYMSGFVFAFGWMALRVRTFDRDIPLQLPAYSPILGISMAVAGAVLAILCAGVFVVRGRGTPAIFDPPRKFVALGPYKYVRNPMYIGGLALLMGLGLYLRSVSILILTLILFLAVHLFVFFYEEPTLRKKFGAAYEDYCRTVMRWIPRLPQATKNGGARVPRVTGRSAQSRWRSRCKLHRETGLIAHVEDKFPLARASRI